MQMQFQFAKQSCSPRLNEHADWWSISKQQMNNLDDRIVSSLDTLMASQICRVYANGFSHLLFIPCTEI